MTGTDNKEPERRAYTSPEYRVDAPAGETGPAESNEPAAPGKRSEGGAATDDADSAEAAEAVKGSAPQADAAQQGGRPRVAPPVRKRGNRRAGSPGPAGLLPGKAKEDDPRVWGDSPEDRDSWLLEQRPPHWG
ncbi:hypothetical protein MUK71_12335 [Arthrobacter zhangbolii]|uniref:Uncharacterized protein n=1 Tax=Arthrobacter zhangbolii TaxID=2886936 RepID=A0A9X1S8P6_9MICC|nr:hypothetical protein [Arthrobacter zhangbolii]MCC3272785.1 hypothetical protein [Arthrobacter zhangbolii]MCC3294956.1 hypothetical protein [Arthrobacter zhangbolii]UON91381.1 hypothetical protein MUK71_12335 [Arthrobacter zhangbolii]